MADRDGQRDEDGSRGVSPSMKRAWTRLRQKAKTRLAHTKRVFLFLVGARGFEPPTTCTPCLRTFFL